MTPAKYNISIWRGAYLKKEFIFPIDLNGYVANIYYKNNQNILSSINLSLSEYSNVPEAKWSAKLELSQIITRQFPLGKNIPYELQLKSPDNKDYVYIQGDLIIRGGTNAD